MTSFRALLVWELRRLLRTGTARAALALLLGAGLAALAATDRELARQAREIAALPEQYEAQVARIAKQFPAGEHAGYVAYYSFLPTWQPAAPLAAFSLGLRDVVPGTLWIRLLGLEGQLHESGLGNPAVQALGTFDLAFVVSALAPLVLLVLCHDLLSRDREQGILPLVVAQAGGLGPLFAARLAVRAAAVAAACTALFAAGLAWHGISPGAAEFGWFADMLLHLAVWTAVAAAIAALCRSVAASLAAAGAAWVAAAVVLPAALNLAVVAAYPVPEGLELTVRQRQEIHAGWDRPKEETFARFFRTYPQWRDTAPVTGRFAWKWYYAMHQAGDDSVADASARYRANLRARAAATARLAALAPPVAAQLLLARRAGTDLESHLAYLDRVRAFHGAMKAHFHPPVFAETVLPVAAWRDFPRFVPAPPPAGAGTFAERLPLLVPLLLGAAVAALALRRPFRPHA